MNQEVAERQDPPYVAAIKKSENRFHEVAHDMPVNYDRECIFAMQALMKNDFAMKTANNNPRSVQLAMINVGSTGLTLNPANAYAYLVPRDGSILLDISYKGLIKIATDSGAIVWARADIVYSEDSFKYHGPAAMPEHTADPFGSRGDVVGCYCIAKTRDGDILTEVMPMAELDKIRNASTAYTKGSPGRKGPWESWFEQMAKKAVIKRASKTWPYTDERMAHAIERSNHAEGGYTFDADTAEKNVTPESEPEQPQALPFYPADKFDKNFDSWLSAIESGKATAEQVIAKVETRGQLSDDQKAAIRGVKTQITEET